MEPETQAVPVIYVQHSGESVRGLARARATAIEAAKVHGLMHQEADGRARRARRLARQRLASEGPWFLEQRLLEQTEEASELLAALRRPHVRGLGWLPDASLYETRTLIDALARPALDGGLSRAAKRLGVKRIWAIEWRGIAEPRRDLAATAAAALEALRDEGRARPELVALAETGLRAARALADGPEAAMPS